MRTRYSLRTASIKRITSRSFVICLIISVLFSGLRSGTATSAPPQENAQPETLAFSENFDGVVAPNLPAGWTSSATGALQVPFVTSSTTPDTAPNAVFAPNFGQIGLSEITSPPIPVGSTGAHFIFRHNYALEGSFDGGVVEIKIGANDFVDIIQAGGTFVTGGYNGTISTGFGNPIGGRQAWTGISGPAGTYLTTDVILPQAAQGRVVQFKWRLGTDNIVAATGWRVDTVLVSNISSGENPANIAIPDSGTASNYPSTINVTGLIGAVTNVIVVLNNFSHTGPDDVDMLLVAPNGRKVVLMSDAGGSIPATNLTFFFDDNGASPLSDNGPLTSGTYKPTDYEVGDIFPAPAPQGPATGSTLAAFNGISAVGNWSLYVVDDNGNNAGSVAGGWALLVGTDAAACSLGIFPTLQVFPITGGNGSFDIDSPFGCDWSAVSLDSFITITSGTSGSGDATITFSVEPNLLAGRTGLIKVTNASGIRNFSIQQPSGCPFSLSQETFNFGPAGGPGTVNVTAAGVCPWSTFTKDNWITINSGAGMGNGVVNFTVQSNGTTEPRIGTVMIGARTLTIVQAQGTQTAFDFDGDTKADLSVFRPGESTWYISNSLNGSFSARQFGINTDRLAPADYDGDGRTDLAVFRDGTWYVLRSSNNSFTAVQWGTTGDTPVPADFDGDFKADMAVLRPSTGTWYVLRSSDGANTIEQFGITEDRPVTGDYDGDHKADFAVFRPSAGTWYVKNSSNGVVQSLSFGLDTDKQVPADYDGDGKTDIAVYRPSTGTWYLQQSLAGFVFISFGISTDTAVAADYDGDQKADFAVFRQGLWYILQSTNGQVRAEQWGQAGDVPVPSSLGAN